MERTPPDTACEEVAREGNVLMLEEALPSSLIPTTDQKRRRT